MEPRISIITLGVADLERSYRFYRDGLGLPTRSSPERGIVFFDTGGVTLALYPIDRLAEDAGLQFSGEVEKRPMFHGVTIAHNVREEEEVDAIIDRALKAGGTLVKKPRETMWGGYSGYFSDPDGYLWEVAYAEAFRFNTDGSMIIP